MTVRYYQSSDTLAPQLTGEQDTLNNLLNDCLVNGYGTKTAAGWTREYDNANVSVFRNGAGSNQLYLQVADDLVATPHLARVQGYESMTSYDTGTAPFYTSAQLLDGYWLKSDSSDSNARTWFMLADESVFYLFVNKSSSSDFNDAVIYAFGDFESKNLTDSFNTLLICENNTGTTTSNTNFQQYSSNLSGTLSGHFIARATSQIGGSIEIGKTYESHKNGMQYPNTADGGLYMSPIYVHEPSQSIFRGQLKGVYRILHDGANFGYSDTVDGTGTLAGRSFFIIKAYNNIAYALEISDTW